VSHLPPRNTQRHANGTARSSWTLLIVAYHATCEESLTLQLQQAHHRWGCSFCLGRIGTDEYGSGPASSWHIVNSITSLEVPPPATNSGGDPLTAS